MTIEDDMKFVQESEDELDDLNKEDRQIAETNQEFAQCMKILNKFKRKKP